MPLGADATFTTTTSPIVTTTPLGTAVPVDGADIIKTYDPVIRTVTLQAMRTLEVSTRGRFYIDEEGNATWETSAVRNP